MAQQTSDADLLAQFLSEAGEPRAEAAFAHLVGRHGPMVLGTCRRLTGDDELAADAFQATFLLLARKASAVRVDGSLGPWLHGVAVRIARRARAVAARYRQRFVSLVDLDPPIISCDLESDVREVIDEELARLPAGFRAVLVLCDLEGLTREEAARRLGCPVGTVESRLHRGRVRLRDRLTRRGLAPTVAVGLAVLGPEVVRATVPLALAVLTTRLATGRHSGETVPAGVSELIRTYTENTLMKKLSFAGLLLAAGFCMTFIADFGQADPPRPALPVARPEPPKLADQFAALRAAFESEWQTATTEAAKAKKPSEHQAIWTKHAPDHADYCRRAVDLAVTRPEDPVARDLLLWAIDRPYAFVQGTFADEYARAVVLLVRHHAADVEVARFGLGLDNLVAPARETLLIGAYTAAKDRETRGLSRLALAAYLQRSVESVEAARRSPMGIQKVRLQTFDDEGKLVEKDVEAPLEQKAMYTRLRLQDPAFIQAEAERLFREVIADYGDISYRTRHQLQVEALATAAEPKWLGQRLSAEEVKQMIAGLPKPRTLGEVAKTRLEALSKLRVGQPAPAIDANNLDGQRLKLADFRGQVVVLAFWGTWCGPCMRDVPHERELVERYKNRPFSLLGVNCRETADKAKATVAELKMAWPHWVDGNEGPIQKAYHVETFPTVFVIDHVGLIRAMNVTGKTLDQVLELLVKEAEKSKSGK